MLLSFVYFRIEVSSYIVYTWCIIKDEDDEIEYELCVLLSRIRRARPINTLLLVYPAGYIIVTENAQHML